MKKLIPFIFFCSTPFFINAQNVGIGTTMPQTSLHVNSTAGSAIIRSETNFSSSNAALELKTSAAAFDFLELRKWLSGSIGNIAGISLSGLSQITTGASSAGPLLIGTTPFQPIYFTTDNTVRMVVSGLGDVGIGASSSPGIRLNIVSENGPAVFGRTNFVPAPGTYTSSIIGRISVNSVRGAGLSGIVENAGSTSPVSTGMYGVLGSAIDQGYAIGAFAAAGAGGITSQIIGGSGLALKTFGPLQLQGIGEADGKVLASDASGNATWQLAGGTHTHYGQSWSGSANRGLEISNLFSGDFNVAITGNSNSTTALRSKGVVGSSGSTTGIGVYGINTTGTVFPAPADNSGVSGIAGTGIGVFGSSNSGEGVYGSSITGTSVYGLKGGTSGNAGFFNLTNASNTSAALKAQAAGNTALELNNGYLKVAGTNRTAFTVTATASNSSAHILTLDYPNQSNTDILLVTHNYNPPGASSQYHDYNVGVFWNGTKWTIYNENTLIPILNKSFNVLVIKQ